MKASDIMTIGAITVRPDSTVAHAARLMVERGISGLPVVTANGKLVGMMTEHDLLHRKELGTADHRSRWLDLWLDADKLAHHYAREHGRKVEDVMSRDLVSVGPDTSVREIVEIMETRGIKRVPVVRDGQVIGMVSRANLLSTLARLTGEPPQPVLDDLIIRKKIADEIARQPWAPGASVDIVVRDGVVTLNGTARAHHVKDAVRVVAENAPGTVRVWDNIRVLAES
ncbi:MAG: CBS domain-containing protein [Mesorhizobium sp.]|uniref:CBS domain-containing protein n=1 Tax=Mesorhizobium sp. TaxID=1871066 RepID=UPI000FE8A584|nr:CBS domain-containing protein [Mesorhizobium sp.]RWL80591.1 MAG: CBS domain-containing protein [Mesorhizobium sp.]RWL86013.1 MAG: CBS domain-containing protein [Mesorhizobium sp.]RWL97459.1 MAG: CBS domain-containing protein [Mesorhizobium sp.]RWM00950.1 MAG: CBS domain-containing protein [Mesorhizobium sp.]TIP46154.1 MAG: CBS domain-containing protein [Mesorhizobium sp.]